MPELSLVATCARGIEPLLAAELGELGMAGVEPRLGAVAFRGGWPEVWRANWRLRTANRVLVELATWAGHDGDALAAGARNLVRRRSHAWAGVDAGGLFRPHRSFAIKASSSLSDVRDVRWVALKVKDGIADGQRDRYGRRAEVDREHPDLSLRVFLHRNQATLLLDTSGEPLDRRGYRTETVAAPVREQLAAAAILASGWDGQGPVVDPMCGSGTLLIEAAWIALGRAPGHLRESWAFERLPGFNKKTWEVIRAEPIPAPGPNVKLYGVDQDLEALAATQANLERAGLADRAHLALADAFTFVPPPGPGLFAVNPAYGERLTEAPEQWRRLGDLLKHTYPGYRAVVLAGGESQGQGIGLKPSRRIPVKNGALEARLLVFELFEGKRKERR